MEWRENVSEWRRRSGAKRGGGLRWTTFPWIQGGGRGGGGCARTNQLYTPVSSPFPIPSPLFFLFSSNLFCLAFRLEEKIFGKRNSRRRGKEREVSSDKFHLLAIILLGVGGWNERKRKWYAQVCFKLTLSKRDLAQRYMYITSIIYINVNFVLG